MKSQALTHLLVNTHGKLGHDTARSNEGKEPFSADQVGQDFASLMANHLVSRDEELDIPLHASDKDLQLDGLVKPESMNLPDLQNNTDARSLTMSNSLSLSQFLNADNGREALLGQFPAEINAISAQPPIYKSTLGSVRLQNETLLQSKSLLSSTAVNNIQTHTRENFTDATAFMLGNSLYRKINIDEASKNNSFANQSIQAVDVASKELVNQISTTIDQEHFTPGLLQSVIGDPVSKDQQMNLSSALHGETLQPLTSQELSSFNAPVTYLDGKKTIVDVAVVYERVQSPAFQNELANRVSYWVKESTDSNGALTAELRLNPAEMGPVYVSIKLDGSTAQLSFVAQNIETRQAIEASYAALFSTLEEVGIKLSSSDVSDQLPQQQDSPGFGAKGDDANRHRQAQPIFVPRDQDTATRDVYLEDEALLKQKDTTANSSGLDLYA